MMDTITILVPVLLAAGVVVFLLLFLRGGKHKEESSVSQSTALGGYSLSSPQEAPYLAAITGPLRDRNFAITSDYFTIGRSTENELVIEGGLVSRQHALIVRQQGQYILYDRESTNGTWVNGSRIAQHVLQPGEQIQIGSAVFVFQRAGVPVEAQPVRQVAVAQIATPSPESVAQRVGGLADYDLTLLPGGEGGAARVYKGVSRRDGSVVAVKVLYKADPYLRTKFEQEGRKIGLLLRHPHITEVYHYGETEDGTFYILMEYVPNGSLRQRIRPRVGLPLAEAIRITGETCDALQFAHSQGIIHRDVKPENILLGARDEVKLADFGIAKLAGARTVTQDGLLIGTPYYMSFEQAKGHPVDIRSDVYALGIVLYEMLTGCVPFTGDALTVVHKHITEAPVPPSRLNSAIPGAVEQVVMRALEKDINRRFGSAEQMARALGYVPSLSQPRPVAERPPLVFPAKRPPSPVESGRLTVLQTGAAVPLTSDITILHRRDINPKDGLISRDHARLFRRNGNLWLEDIGSTNGTYLNGQRLFEPALVKPGDEIRLGGTVLRVEGS